MIGPGRGGIPLVSPLLMFNLTNEQAEWAPRGACRGMDPGTFFPDRGQNVGHVKAICHTCEVEKECLDYAVTSRQVFGIWGGTSERERRNMRRLAKQPLN